ncbi:MAG: haloacid dehalogenase type II [Chloroflexota bacterium]
MKLTSFKALTFDCYGTLIDWESGMIAALEPLTSRVLNLTRDQILEAHARHESGQQAQTPWKLYPEILSLVYKRLAEEWGVPAPWEACQVYGQSVKDWPAFADSAESLRYLKQHYKLVILSNVDNQSFAASNAKLNVEFDAIYTAQDIGTYKPKDANFEYMLRHLKTMGIESSDILHTAESLFHDHVPGKRNGLANCWIYRRHEQEGFGATMNPGEMPPIDFKFNSMAALVSAHKAELANG